MTHHKRLPTLLLALAVVLLATIVLFQMTATAQGTFGAKVVGVASHGNTSTTMTIVRVWDDGTVEWNCKERGRIYF